jgi:hypothetical protein
MSEQPDLFGTPEAPANKLEAAFWEFHAARPDVYELVDRFSRIAAARRPHFSINVVFERIRWETNIERGEVDFKINNNHRPYYARLWMRHNPAHKGFFRTRELKAGKPSDRIAVDADLGTAGTHSP